jgi:NAD(P)H-hydrate repair Nnr-like enzyme with NAD(P)H-hydrate dehydratase domain
MVVDAGALENVAKARAAGARETPSDRVLMTPHIEELMRTLDALRHDVTWADVVQDRAGHARLLAEKTRATVLLKGSQTVIASPGGSLVELPPAVAWLATAGSGDVLAGIAGTLLAAGLTASDAGASAAWVHAEAGKRASGASTGPGGPLAALDIASYVPVVIAELLSF